MKKILFPVLIAVTMISCQEETRAKVKDASKAVGAEVKVAAQKTKAKVAKVIDTTKVKQKFKAVVAKGAEKVEQGAKKLKESATK